MIGPINLTPDKWYHKLWFYPLCWLLIALLPFLGMIESWYWKRELKKRNMKKGEVNGRGFKLKND